MPVKRRASGSSGDMQALSIVVTTDPALKEAMHPLHFSQDRVLEAPALLTFCSDFHRRRKGLEACGAHDNFDTALA